MNCRRIEELIPLYVEDDLNSNEADVVLSHLKSCGECGHMVEQYKESQAWLRKYAPPDFDSEFFNSLKKAVLKDIQESRPTFFQLISWPWKPAFAISVAVLFILGGLTLYIHFEKARSNGRLNYAMAKETPDQVEQPSFKEDIQKPKDQVTPRPGRRHRPANGLHAGTQKSRKPVVGPGIISVARKISSPESVNPSSEGTTHEDMMRIELQTSDPSIRIIWFAPKEIKSNSSKSASDAD